MVCAMCRFLVVLLLTVAYLSCVKANFNKYVPLISDVHNAYGTSGIFFVFPSKKFSMDEYTTAHLLTRTYSQQGVFTLMTNFEDLKVHLSHNWKRTARPLVVVLVKSIDDINEFQERTQRRTKSFPIWLVIFKGHYIDPVCKYCRQPEGNTFGLRFDTLMRVVCCDEVELQEWWSVRENHTEIGYIGTWSADNRLKLVATDKLKSRRSDFQGAEVRVAAEPENSSVASSALVGYWNHIFRRMKNEWHCKLSFYNKSLENSSEILNSVQLGKPDLAAAIIIMSEGALSQNALTYPMFSLHSKLYIKQADTMSFNLSYFKVLESKIWLHIIALVVTTPVLLMIMKLQQGAKLSGSLYSENCLFVWGIFCQQGIPKFSVPTSMRIAYFSIFISGVIVYMAYSASLISILTNASSTLPFSDLQGFFEDGSYRIIVPRGNDHYNVLKAAMQHKNDSTIEKIGTLMKPTEDLPATMMDAWKEVCSRKVALLTFKPYRRIRWNNCRLIEINVGDEYHYAMPFARDSQYTGALNYQIKRSRKLDLYVHIRETDIIHSVVPETVNNDSEFVLGGGIILILVVGMILSLIVMFCEKIHHRWRNRQRLLPLRAKPRKIKIRNPPNSRRKQHS